MTRFNIAFIPKMKSASFTKLAEAFKTKSNNYCLGDNSLPHVTVCQFFAEENQIDYIWNQVHSSIDCGDISLCFKTFSHLSFDNVIYWLSLLPEPNQKLTDIFNVISKIVKSIRKDEYDPHLTLFNYRKDTVNVDSKLEEEINIGDEFELAIGVSDDYGQLNKILYTYSQILNKEPSVTTISP